MQTVLEVVAALFAIVAGYFLFLGFSAETTVAYDGQVIANAQPMHYQLVHILIGVGSALISAVLFAGAAIIAAIRFASEASDTP